MQRILVTIIVLILSAAIAVPGIISPLQSSASTQPSMEEIMDMVDGDRIMATITDLQALGTRAFYLNQSAEAALYVHDRLRELDLQVEYQDFMAGVHPSTNVVATQLGLSDPEKQFLFGAHYDSENMLATSMEEGRLLPAPGADDDASGVAAVIEIATVLNELSLACSVRYVAFGAEELGYDESGGLKGSDHFVAAEKARGANYQGTAILDMIGYKGNDVNHATLVIDQTNELANATVRFASDASLDLSLHQVVGPSISYSDHYPFWTAGYPSMLVCEAAPDVGLSYEFNPTYHTEDDSIDYLSKEQMTELAKALVGGMLALNGLASDEDDDRTALIVALVVVCAVVAVVITLYISKVRR